MQTRKETLETLKNAASTRKHEFLKKLTEGESDEVPSLLYLRKCYQYFTLKRSLEKIENDNKRKSEILNTKLQENHNFDLQEDDIRPKRGEFGNTVNRTVLLPKKCLFCKKDKYVKRIKERLVACLEFRAVQSIKAAVTKINDFQMLGLITDDLIATEAHYHSSCYKLDTKVNQDNVISVTTDQNEKAIYKSVEFIAFKEVVKECYQLLENPTVLPYNKSFKTMEKVFEANNIDVLDSSRFYLRRNLEKHVDFIKYINVNGLLYDYPKNYSVEELIPEHINLSKKIECFAKELDQPITTQNITKSGRQMKKEMKNSMPWPPQPNVLAPDKIEIPQSLRAFLETVMDTRPARLMNLVAQDIIYNVSAGRIRTVKSVLLPSIVNALTNNTELIHILNRFGHGISYTLLMEAQTENAYQLIEQQLCTGCVIPKESIPDSFTIFVADNIDRQEQTLSGMRVFTLLV